MMEMKELKTMKMLLSGNQAAARAVKLARVQVVSAYPITPQTSLIENLAQMWAEGDFDGDFVGVESEYSALSYLIGAASAGARSFTASSSHGLAYMHEVLHWVSGARLPLVLVNVNRTIGAPWCLEPDQGDSLSQRDTGWIQLYCASVQEILDTVLVAFYLAEQTRVPCMVSYDGFSLSHTHEPVDVPDQETVDGFLPPRPEVPVLPASNGANLHNVVTSQVMNAVGKSLHRAMKTVPRLIKVLEKDFLSRFGRPFTVLESDALDHANTVIITSGSVAQTVKSALPDLSSKHGRIGLVRLKLFRPFPGAELVQLLERTTAQQIIVLDRNLSPGAGGIFAQEIRSALQQYGFQGAVREFNLVGGIDLTPEMLHKGLVHMAETSTQSQEEPLWGGDLI